MLAAINSRGCGYSLASFNLFFWPKFRQSIRDRTRTGLPFDVSWCARTAAHTCRTRPCMWFHRAPSLSLSLPTNYPHLRTTQHCRQQQEGEDLTTASKSSRAVPATNIQTTSRCTGRHTDRQTDAQTGRQTDKDAQTDRCTGRQTYRYTDKQTDKSSSHQQQRSNTYILHQHHIMIQHQSWPNIIPTQHSVCSLHPFFGVVLL